MSLKALRKAMIPLAMIALAVSLAASPAAYATPDTASSSPAASPLPTASPLPAASSSPTPKPTVIRSRPNSGPDPYPSNPANLTEGHLYAQACILIDGNTGEVLFSKRETTRLMPASITKMMTCLLAIERCNLDEMVTVASAANKVEATYLPVEVGEQIRLGDLLTGMMLKSANDAAVAVACHVAGDEAAFVELMNQRAQEIGCRDTVYMNAHGLTVAGHATTAYDQALVAKECMENATFREIVSTLEITIPKNDVYTEKDRVITNANLFLPALGDNDFGYEYGIGVKTGYTDAAQSTFVGAAVKDGVYLISVVLGSTREGKWKDSAALMDYGFTLYEEVDVKNLYELHPLKISVENASVEDPSQGDLTLKMVVPPDVTNDPIMMTSQALAVLTEDFLNRVQIEYARDLRAPVLENETLAYLTLRIGDAVFKASLLAPTAVESAVMANDDGIPTPTQIADGIVNQPTPTLMQRFWWIFILPAAALILIIVGCAMEIRRRKKRRMRSSYSRYLGASYSTTRRR